MQHVGNRAIIDGVVHAVLGHGLGVVLFNDAIDVGELLQALPQRGLVAGRLRSNVSIQESARSTADDKKHDDEQQRTASTGSHEPWVPFAPWIGITLRLDGKGIGIDYRSV